MVYLLLLIHLASPDLAGIVVSESPFPTFVAFEPPYQAFGVNLLKRVLRGSFARFLGRSER